MSKIREIAKEILTNVYLIQEIHPRDIPVSEIKQLNPIQIGKLEYYATTLGELVDNWPNLAIIARETEIDRFTLEKICSTITLLIDGSDERYLHRKATGTNYIKMIFVGLSGAGKTSIIQFLKRRETLKLSQETLTNSKPTMGDRKSVV